jgi:ketosteroid isomerase-like protein
MTRQQVTSILARREQALSRRDVAGLAALYSNDAVIESPTAGGTVRGRAAIEEVSRTWFTGFRDVTFTAGTVLIDGECAVWIGEVRGTDTGGFMGLAPTGKPFRLPMVLLCTVKDGLIVHEQRIYDFTGVLMQIGVLKAKPI